MRAYNATVGETDGNIIAAIITTQAPGNQPAVPSAAQGPASIPAISPATHHQPSPASPKSTATSPSRARAAANAGSSPGSPAVRSEMAITSSGCPGEVGRRQPGLALVLDAEPADPRALRLGHRQVGADRVEHAVELDGLAVLLAERDDVVNLEVDGVADADVVGRAVDVEPDRDPLDADPLADERRQARHRAAELTREDGGELVSLLVV